MDTERERRYAELKLAISTMENETKKLKEEADLIEADLLSSWADMGLGQVRVDGTLLFLQETTFATLPEGKDAAVAMLKSGEYAGIVRDDVNSNTLSALVRELKAEGTIPESWKGVIEPGSKMNIRVRKS